jgi:hypothetical protein
VSYELARVPRPADTSVMPNVADLTLEKFRELVRQTVRETLLELTDPDAGLGLRPEIEQAGLTQP